MTKPTFDDIVNAVIELFPKLNLTEQRISVALYRLLAKGQPIAREALAAEVRLPVAEINAVLSAWYGVFYDKANRIIGYWGLALSEMKHRFRVNGNGLYTWCAWDNLFIPQILGATAEVESACPVTNDAIYLTVDPDGIKSVQPVSAVVSFVTPEQAKIKENVVLNFCHHVHFLRSEGAGKDWTSRHPGALFLTLDQAFELGRRKNSAQYGDVLEMIETT